MSSSLHFFEQISHPEDLLNRRTSLADHPHLLAASSSLSPKLYDLTGELDQSF